MEVAGPSGEATLAGRTQAWPSGDLGANAGPAADTLRNPGKDVSSLGLSYPMS